MPPDGLNLIRGDIFLKAKEFIAEELGEEALERLMRELREAGCTVDLSAVGYNTWYQLSDYQKFIHTVGKLFGADFLRRMGMDFIRHPPVFEEHFRSARAFFLQLPRYIRKYETGVDVEILEMGKNYGIIEIRNMTVDPYRCAYMLGILEGTVGAIKGMKAVKPIKCRLRGDSTCVYRFEWE